MDHQGGEAQVAEADDEEPDEVACPGGLSRDHPGDDEPQQAVAPDVEAEVGDEVGVHLDGQGIGGKFEAGYWRVAAANEHLPLLLRRADEVLKQAFDANINVKDAPERKERGADMSGSPHLIFFFAADALNFFSRGQRGTGN